MNNIHYLYRFKMATVGERNKIMKLLDKKGYDPTVIEDPAPYICFYLLAYISIDYSL